MIRAIILIALAAVPANAQKISEPSPGTAKRAAIMDEIREGTDTRGNFVVDHLRVVDADGRELAFADVHPADSGNREGFTGWALLSYGPDKPWKYVWGVHTPGRERCDVVARAYSGTVEIMSLYDVPMSFVSPRFLSQRAIVNSKASSAYCPGTAILPTEE